MGPLLKSKRWDLALKSRGAKPQNQDIEEAITILIETKEKAMAKGKNTQKTARKKSDKTLKEKRKEKKDKKSKKKIGGQIFDLDKSGS